MFRYAKHANLCIGTQASGARALSACVQRDGEADGVQTAAAAQSAQASEARAKGQGARSLRSLVEPHSAAPPSYNEREFTLKESLGGSFSTTLVTSAACTAGGGEQRKRHTSRVGRSQSGDELRKLYHGLE